MKENNMKDTNKIYYIFRTEDGFMQGPLTIENALSLFIRAKEHCFVLSTMLEKDKEGGIFYWD